MRLEVFLFLMWLSLIYAYNAKNVDSKDVIFLKNPHNASPKNGFGHSVALSKNYHNHYVYVGAPHDKTHGNVFKCSFNVKIMNQQNPTCYKVDGK